MKKLRNIFILSLIFILVSCQENDELTIYTDMSDEAEEYLQAALDIMEYNSINRYKIEWASFREETFRIALSARSTADTYNAIRSALERLGDNHSFFMEPENGPLPKISIPGMPGKVKFYNPASDVLGLRITENIGFIRIPGFMYSGNAAIVFANSIQEAIRENDGENIKAWIVDLRQNSGGNMWPMLAGAGPILGEGLAGMFVDPDNNITKWYYEDGKALYEENPVVTVENYYELMNDNPRVAVLTNRWTASSGEAMVIAFRGREKTKSFGENTYGVSTANRSFVLSDGALLVLTVSTMADREGNLYGYKVEPDVQVKGDFRTDPTNNDNVVEAAVEYLESVIDN